MGKKKQKEPDTSTAQNHTVSAPSDIFKTLFSGAEQTACTSSLFSNSNPFKRKPDDPKSNENPSTNVDTPNPDLYETTEKPKKVKTENTNLGFEPKAEETLMKRKKRKRDDLEREYEAKKYGPVIDNGENARPFCWNLPLKVKKKTLIRIYPRYREGAILLKKFNDNVDRYAVVFTKKMSMHMFFKNEQSAEASLSHNMAWYLKQSHWCNRHAHSQKVKGSDAPLYDNKGQFCCNLPFDVKDEEIYQLFTGIKDLASSIEAVRVIRDPHEAATLAIKKWNLKLRDRELRLSHARQDSTPSKRKNSFAEETANSPNKRLAPNSRAPGPNNWPDRKAAKSYQGLRASKSGVEKKVHVPAHSKRDGAAKMKSKPRGEKQPGKRPAAQRKAKATALKRWCFRPARQKRKLDSRTPDIPNREKNQEI
ncbi:RNA recognition motif-containing family protein [Salix suchowensis]|nr:RNA recognition motif-containing family protein [Salix suchowensis]